MRAKLTAILTLGLALLFLVGCGNFGAGPRAFEDDADRLGRTSGGEDEVYPVSYDASGGFDSISLVQAIISGINGDIDGPAIYKSVPRKHLEDISLNQFLAYIEALRPSRGERIDSFQRLQPDAEQKLRDEIGHRMPLIMELAQTTIFFELNYRSENYTPEVITIGVHLHEDGGVFLSGQWVRPILRIHDYAQLYFDAIKNKDLPAVSWLLEEGYQHFEEGDVTALSKKKAQMILSFYENKVVSNIDENICEMILPGRARYKQRYSITDFSQADRSMEIREEYGKLTAYEPIPTTLESSDKILYLYGKRVLPERATGRWPQYRSDEVLHLIGEIIDIRPIEDEADATEDYERFYVDYGGATFLIEGAYDLSEMTWEGDVVQIDVSSSAFSFGDELRVGMSAYDFYSRYPFAPEDDFTVSAMHYGQQLSITAQIEDDAVQRFIWRLD